VFVSGSSSVGVVVVGSGSPTTLAVSTTAVAATGNAGVSAAPGYTNGPGSGVVGGGVGGGNGTAVATAAPTVVKGAGARVMASWTSAVIAVGMLAAVMAL
jgi:hypothetical protein